MLTIIQKSLKKFCIVRALESIGSRMLNVKLKTPNNDYDPVNTGGFLRRDRSYLVQYLRIIRSNKVYRPDSRVIRSEMAVRRTLDIDKQGTTVLFNLLLCGVSWFNGRRSI